MCSKMSLKETNNPENKFREVTDDNEQFSRKLTI